MLCMFVRCRPVTENLTRETSAIARYGARLTSFNLFLARTLGNPLYGRDDLRIREVFVPLLYPLEVFARQFSGTLERAMSEESLRPEAFLVGCGADGSIVPISIL